MQKTKNKLGKLALFATSLSLLGSSLLTGSITPVLAEGESFRLDEVISTYAPFPESEEDAWQSDTDCCCYINYLSGELVFRTAARPQSLKTEQGLWSCILYFSRY